MVLKSRATRLCIRIFDHGSFKDFSWAVLELGSCTQLGCWAGIAFARMTKTIRPSPKEAWIEQPALKWIRDTSSCARPPWKSS